MRILLIAVVPSYLCGAIVAHRKGGWEDIVAAVGMFVLGWTVPSLLRWRETKP